MTLAMTAEDLAHAFSNLIAILANPAHLSAILNLPPSGRAASAHDLRDTPVVPPDKSTTLAASHLSPSPEMPGLLSTVRDFIPGSQAAPHSSNSAIDSAANGAEAATGYSLYPFPGVISDLPGVEGVISDLSGVEGGNHANQSSNSGNLIPNTAVLPPNSGAVLPINLGSLSMLSKLGSDSRINTACVPISGSNLPNMLAHSAGFPGS